MPLKRLQQNLAQLEATGQEHDEIVAEAAALFAEGKINHEQLDQAITQRDANTRRCAALEAAIKSATSKDARAEAARIEAERQAAAKSAEGMLAAIGNCAADFDAAVHRMVNVGLRFEELGGQFRRVAYAAGMRGSQANYLTDLRPVAAVLASALSRSHLAEKLDFITVAGSHDAHSAADSVALRNGKLAKMLANLAKPTQGAKA